MWFPCWRANRLLIDTCYLLREKNTSSSTFIFIITTQHYQLKGLQDETRGCETRQGKKKKKITEGRLKRSTKWTNIGGVVSYSLRQQQNKTKKKLQNETERPSGLNLKQCTVEALKSMTTTLPWMPTITQMVYLENCTGHLTKSRHSTDTARIPPPTSMILTGLFVFVTMLRSDIDHYALTIREPSVGF